MAKKPTLWVERCASLQTAISWEDIIVDGMTLTSSYSEHSQINKKEPIAIIGIGCRFPGNVNSPETFWQLLCDQVDAITEIPPGRFEVEAFYDPQPRAPGKIVTRQGGFLEQVDQFDADFFGISPREANCMDPQQRLLLEVAWEALEDGGQRPDKLAGSQTGVFIGMWTNDYEDIMYNASDDIDLYVTTGGGRYAASGRLSYFFDFQGPSLTVDTACSSSLVTVHLACQSLWNGESTLALAGGVNLILEPQITIGYSRSGMLSPDAHCKFGDVRADGYGRSEGAGIVVLKRLSQALADKDSIYALIRGGAVNNDGRSSGLLVAPGVETQATMLRQAYRNAGISPGQVSYVEAHGTGTKVGDPTELQALGMVLAENRPPNRPCIIGSVKTNIGHTEAASGVAGLIKASLCLKHRTIPANLNLHDPNPNISWSTLPLVIQQKLTPWPETEGPAFAGVNSFGVTGTNAHLILEEAPLPVLAEEETDPASADRPYLLPLSAHTPEALGKLLQLYHTFISQQGEEVRSLQDLGYTLAKRRAHHEYRLALVAQDRPELLEQLASYLGDEVNRGADVNRQGVRSTPKVVFVFSGQGPQWPGMGKAMLETEPIFRATIEECDDLLHRQGADWSLLAELTAEPTHSRLNETEIAQPAIFALQVALATLWHSWGIKPEAVVGHSLGEIAAAYVAGVLTLPEAVRIVFHRGRLMQQATGLGKMAAIGLPQAETELLLVNYPERLSIAAVNSPTSTVLSGDSAALEEVLRSVTERGAFGRMLPVNYAFHSPQMEPFQQELVWALAELTTRPATLPIYSTVTGALVQPGDFNAAYWGRNIREPVRFAEAIAALEADGYNAYVEISPHPVLAPSISECLSLSDGWTILPSLRRNQSDQAIMLHALAALYSRGCSVNWNNLCHSSGRFVRLPAYPWQRDRFWYEGTAKQGYHHQRRSDSHPLLGPHVYSATGAHLWQIELSSELFPYLADHKVRGQVVLPATAYIEVALAAASEAFGSGLHILTNIVFKEALFLPETDLREAQLIITSVEPGTAMFQFFSRAAKSHEPQAWLLHASGTIRLDQAQDSPSCLTPVKAIRSTALSGSEHYRAMTNRQLQYGPSFQAVVQLWRLLSPNEIIGELQTPETISLEMRAYQLHPSLMDACFQLLIATLGDESWPAATDTYLPIHIDRLLVYDQPNPGSSLWGYAIQQARGETLQGDVFLIDEAGQTLLAVYGLQMQRLAHDTEAEIKNWLYELRWQLSETPAQQGQEGQELGSWLLFADRHGVGEQLAARLEELGQGSVMVFTGEQYRLISPGRYQLNPTQLADFQHLLKETSVDGQPPYRGIIHLWSLDVDLPDNITTASMEIVQAQGCLSILHLIQALDASGQTPSPHLWLVTSGSQGVGPAPETIAALQAALWGLGGVITHEHPELSCKRIDLSPSITQQDIEGLWTELWSPSAEDQVALRGGKRYVARLIHYAIKTSTDELEEATQVEAQPGQAYQLEIPTPGILDNLILREATRCTPGPGQVEIEIQAAGLNFIDVMKAMGIYPGLDPNAAVALGGEGAGRIVAVGENVQQFKVGDEVIAINSSFDRMSFFSRYVTVPAELVVPRPAHLSPEEAATIPINFLTAYYAMIHLGQLRQGERVLIHSATGGVGLAAIQLAKWVGAEIFATAGTPEKRTYLQQLGIRHVMDSRSLSFAEEVKDQTNDQGVDMVLNSLAGEAIQKSLATLAPYGRFLEIGKRDIYQNSPLGLEPFRKNLSFFAIDLARMTRERPALIGSLFRELIHYFKAQTLQALPLKVFPISQASEAFRYMAQAKHIGKVIISLQNQPVRLTEAVKSPTPIIQSDGTYLITGGLGGLGLTVARWLADQGAGHLILMGRSGASVTAQAVIDNLEAAGTRVTMAQADVTQIEDVAKVLRQIKETKSPLRGIIHAAGVLEDGILLQLDQEKFKRVLAPKLNGAWNLHTLTQKTPLDFFILFSSVTALLGSPGQGNYVAANAFLDALAHHRRAQGQPGLSINWGPWAEVGLAAAQSNRGDRLADRGLGLITPDQGIAALNKLIQQGVAQIGVMPFDLQRWIEYVPASGKLPFFDELQADKSTDRSSPQKNNIHDALLAVGPGRQRQALFETHLREQVAQVLQLVPSRIPLNKPLKTLGFDSLMTLELRNRLETSLGLSLSATLFFNYPTIKALIPYLAEKMAIPLGSIDLAKDGSGTDIDPQAELPPDLDDLSQDKVVTMLADELAMIDELLKGI